jgi:Tol biopolymer transport system component
MKKVILSLLVIFASGSLIAQSDSTQVKDSVEEKSDKKKLPLKAERTYHLETDEGTWLSLDVSSDGKNIAFDLLGDIYLLSMEGGKAKRLTSGLAFDTHPRFSPDGRKLLFISDRSGSENVWLLDISSEINEPEQFTEQSKNSFQSADWSPDGKYIVTSEGRRALNLRMYHIDGGSGADVNESDLKLVEPAFSADGRFIYYSSRSGGWQYNASLPQYQLAVYDRETGESENVTSRYGSAFSPTLSPDGAWLVYGTRHNTETGLILRNLSTGEEKWLAYPVQRDEQESIATLGVLPAMSFTPDSKFVIASYGGKIHRIPVAGGDATEIPFTVTEDIAMGPLLSFDYPVSDSPQMTVTQIRDVVTSPDGSRIAFTALNRLYLMNLTDSTPVRVTNMEQTEAQPCWSPDGESLVFVTWSEKDGGHIYKVNTNGRMRPVQLTSQSALYTEPAWSYDNRIVYLKGFQTNFQNATGPRAFQAQNELYWIAPEGGESHFISKSLGRSAPHFVKSDNRIYLYSGRKGLVSIRWDGTDEKEILKVTGITTYGTTLDELGHRILIDTPGEPKQEPSDATLIKMAPQGDQALALINNDIYTVTVPRLGKEVVTISVASPEKAAFPARKLTEIGGQFPSWSEDAKKVYWSIGNAFFTYNLDEARLVEKELERKKKAAEEEKKDDAKEEKKEDAEEKEKSEEKEGYTPQERRVKVEIKRDLPEGRILLQNARIITMENEEVLENGDILIENNRISAVGPTGTLSIPKGTEIMKMDGKTILPGFIDTHAHMRPAWGLQKSEVWSYAANLAYGVTTTRDPQTGTTDVLTYSDMVDAGMINGPRIYSTGPGVGYWAYNIKDLDHARNVLKQYSEYYDTKTIKMYMTGNRQQRQWIIMAAKEQKLMPTTEGALDFKLNMTQILDGYPGHEHSFPIYPIYKDVIGLVAESETAYTPTLLVSYGGPWAENYYYATENVQGDQKLNYFTPKSDLDAKSRRRNAGWFMEEEHIFSRHAEFVDDLIKAGGIAGVGSHGQLQGLGYHWELWSMQSGGLSEYNALKVATLLGARSIGLENDLGSLVKGKLADLVILDSNPLENIRNTNSIRWVMKNGRLFQAENLQEIYPEKKEAPEFNWHQSVPENVPGMMER